MVTHMATPEFSVSVHLLNDPVCTRDGITIQSKEAAHQDLTGRRNN